jgi:hypothetical protein
MYPLYFRQLISHTIHYHSLVKYLYLYTPLTVKFILRYRAVKSKNFEDTGIAHKYFRHHLSMKQKISIQIVKASSYFV